MGAFYTSVTAALSAANAGGSAASNRSMSDSALYRCGATRMELGASLALRLYVPVLTTMSYRSLSSAASAPLLRSSLRVQHHQTRNVCLSSQPTTTDQPSVGSHGMANAQIEPARGPAGGDTTARPKGSSSRSSP